MLPRDPALFIQPLDPGDFVPSEQNTNPGFGDLVNDTLDNLGTDQDGFEGVLSEAAGAVDAWDQALGEQDAALDSVLLSLNAMSTDELDNSLLGYVGAVGQAQSLVGAGAAMSPPDLGELPLAVVSAGGPGPAPTLVGIDLGTLKLGAPVFLYVIGTRTPTRTGATGTTSVRLVTGNRDIFALVTTSKPVKFADRSGASWVDYVTTYLLQVTPAELGTFTADVNAFGYQGGTVSILTFTVTVV
jgi:hypothetical protein